jgi:biotin carboxylase
MRRRLRSAGLPAGRFAIMSATGAAAGVAARTGLPAIVKPVNGTASSLVRRVASVGELARTYRELTRRAPHELGGMYCRPAPDPDGPPLHPARDLLVESVLGGPEYDLEVIIRDGTVEIAQLIEIVLDEAFQEVGYLVLERPAPGGPGPGAALVAATGAALAALGLDNTIANVTLRDDPLIGPVLIEVNAGRPGGLGIGLMAWHAAGIDLPAEQVAAALGAPPPPREQPRLPPPLAVVVVDRPAGGAITAVDTTRLAGRDGVRAVLPLLRRGDVVDVPRPVPVAAAVMAGRWTGSDLERLRADLRPLVRLESAAG